MPDPIMKVTRPLLIAVLLLMSGCTPDGPVEVGPPNTLTFTYSGARTGTFEAAGSRPGPTVDPRRRTWADAQAINQGESAFMFVRANMVVDGSSSRYVQMTIPELSAGTFPISGEFDSFFPAVIFDQSTNEGYRFAEGSTVTVTSLLNGRVTGTFQGTVTTPDGNITISNGEFDVRWWFTTVIAN